MDWRALRWLAFAAPLVFLAAIDVVRHVVWPQLLHPWPGYLIVLLVVAAGVYLLSQTVFNRVETAERRLLEQNRELREIGDTARRQAAQVAALHEASLALSSELSLDTVLQRVVDLARELAGARYGALSVIDDRGGIVRFLTSGLAPEERARLGDPPRGQGLLGVVVGESRPLRVDSIGNDPRSCGFPPGHPPMATLLGVPIIARGRRYGHLYLTDKQGAAGPVRFEPADEELLRQFATQAAVAMDNARLHAQVQGLAAAAERERLARELHDSLAQVLGYVRLRAAAARGSLQRDDHPAIDEALEQIGAAAADAYADVREAILGLRSHVARERGLADVLAEYLQHYRFQTGIQTVLETDPRLESARAAPGAEAQLLRIIQEALANVRKHAQASQVTVKLEVISGTEGPRLYAHVADDGRGFDLGTLPADARFGLATMRERAEAVGGSLRVEARTGSGTIVSVELPLETAPLEQATREQAQEV